MFEYFRVVLAGPGDIAASDVFIDPQMASLDISWTRLVCGYEGTTGHVTSYSVECVLKSGQQLSEEYKT